MRREDISKMESNILDRRRHSTKPAELKKAAKALRKLEWVQARIRHAEQAVEYGHDPILPPVLKREWNEVWQRELKRLVALHEQYVLEKETK